MLFFVSCVLYAFLIPDLFGSISAIMRYIYIPICMIHALLV